MKNIINCLIFIFNDEILLDSKILEKIKNSKLACLLI